MLHGCIRGDNARDSMLLDEGEHVVDLVKSQVGSNLYKDGDLFVKLRQLSIEHFLVLQLPQARCVG